MADVTTTASITHSAVDWLQILGLGGLIGALGQGARTIVGIKKLSDAASASNGNVADLIVASKMVIAFAIGAVAGAAAAIGTISNLGAISLAEVLGIAAAGYSGADFVEGFIHRSIPSPGAPAGKDAVGTGASGGSAEGADTDDDAEG